MFKERGYLLMIEIYHDKSTSSSLRWNYPVQVQRDYLSLAAPREL